MFRPKTVDGVLAALTKAVASLDSVINEQHAVGLAAFAEIERQEAIRNAAFDEQMRAVRVRERLNELLA